MNHEIALELVRRELERARQKHAAMPTQHHGKAVIEEEVDELWDAVKDDDRDGAAREAVQVAAMAIRFLVDLYSDHDGVDLLHQTTGGVPDDIIRLVASQIGRQP